VWRVVDFDVCGIVMFCSGGYKEYLCLTKGLVAQTAGKWDSDLFLLEVFCPEPGVFAQSFGEITTKTGFLGHIPESLAKTSLASAS
jgi:hypothetical protein